MKIVASFQVLLQKAISYNKALSTEDQETIDRAKEDLDNYRSFCLREDTEMSLGLTKEDLHNIMYKKLLT